METGIGGLVGDFEDAMLDLFEGLRELFLDEMDDRFNVSFGNEYSADNGYIYKLPLPLLNFTDEDNLSALGDEESKDAEEKWDYKRQQEGDEADDKEGDDDITNQTPAHTGYASYYGDIRIKRVSRYSLGYRVLGRAFPRLRLVEVASDLYGREFSEVKTHEILHVRHPELSEWEIRRMTRDILQFAPRFH